MQEQDRKTRVHISLEVNDLDASITFYRQLFQREPTKVKPFYASWRMDAPALHLALMHKPGRAPEPTDGSRHFGIELFADEHLSDWLSAVQKTSVETRIEEQVTCCYAVANKFWAQDPDGHEWEFWVRHGEADELTGDESATCCPTASAEEGTAEQAQAEVKASGCCTPAQQAQAEVKASGCCTPTTGGPTLVTFGRRAPSAS